MIEFRKSGRHSSCISCGSANEIAEVLFRRSADSNAHALTLCKECRSDVASLPSPDYQRGQEEVGAAIHIIEEYLAVLDGGSIPEIGVVESRAPICDKDPYRSYVAAVLDKLRALPAQQESVDLASVVPVTTFAEYAQSKESMCEWKLVFEKGREMWQSSCGYLMNSLHAAAVCRHCKRPIRLGGGE